MNNGIFSKGMAVALTLMMMAGAFVGISIVQPAVAQDIPAPMENYPDEPTDLANDNLLTAQDTINEMVIEAARTNIMDILDTAATAPEAAIAEINAELDTVQDLVATVLGLGGMADPSLDQSGTFNEQFDSLQQSISDGLTGLLVDGMGGISLQNITILAVNGSDPMPGIRSGIEILLDGAQTASDTWFDLWLTGQGHDAIYSDTDGDGIPTIDEIAFYRIYGVDPSLLDTDDDGTGDLAEIQAGTHPAVVGLQADDPDGDGYTIQEENDASSDPYNWRSTPEDWDGDGIQHVIDRGEAPFDPRTAPNIAVSVDTINGEDASNALWIKDSGAITITGTASTKNHPCDHIQTIVLKVSWVNAQGNPVYWDAELTATLGAEVHKEAYPKYEIASEVPWTATINADQAAELSELVGNDKTITIKATASDSDETKAASASIKFHIASASPMVTTLNPVENAVVCVGDVVILNATVEGFEFNKIAAVKFSILRGTQLLGAWAVAKDASGYYTQSWTVPEIQCGE
ncbi:MAG: hypothetical protein PHH26_03005, partial [Candidatus Thermoplasmatota archaeon]|nr:hypothetical protein [Candidatus Thermoplasmatota archaeon]